MPTFYRPRRVQIDTGEPLVPVLGAAALGLAVAALVAVGSWASSVLGALGEVPVPVAVLVPAALGFTGCGYLLARTRVVVAWRPRRAAAAPSVVILERPARAALVPAKSAPSLGNMPGTVPAERGEA